MKHKLGILFVVVMFLSMFSQISQVGGRDSTTLWPTEGWQTSTPEEQGVDSQQIVNLLQSNTEVHTILAIRHGKVFLDVSRYPFTSTQPHALFAVTKSVVSTLVGMAIEKGYIKSINQPIWDFFPKDKTANMDARKEAITIENLLTNRSSLLVADDPDIYKLTGKDAPWVQYILDKPMQADPGTSFQELAANTHLLSAIVQVATKMSTAEFAAKFLFAPLGITDATWLADPQGINVGSDHLFMSPMSMAKLGYLYLHGGQWDGQQIVSSAWVSSATTTWVTGVSGSTTFDFGYLWWTSSLSGGKHPAYLAYGLLGQTIWVVPDLDIVLVTTNDLGLVSRTIITAIVDASISNQPLPTNAASMKALQSRIDELAHPTAANIKPVPDSLKVGSGKVYKLKPNDFGWTSLSIDFSKPGEALMTIGLPDKEIKLPIGLDNVYRVSADGLPAEPVWRPIADVPQMLKAGYLGNRFLVSMGDCMGMEFWTLNINFSKDGSKMWLTAQSLNVSTGEGAPTHDVIGAL